MIRPFSWFGRWWGLASVWILMGTTLVAREMDILPGKYSVDVWQPDDGLPDSTVTSVVQTKDGYLWLGTFLGLARFDGLRFTVFGLATPGLESDRIVQLFADAEGALWVASEYGQLSRYFAGKFTRLTAADGWPDYRVRSMAQAPDGSLLVTAGVEDFGPRLLLRYRDGRFFEVLSGVDSPLVERMQKMQPLGDTMVEAEKSGRLWVIQDRRLGYLEADHWREWRPPNGETTEAVVRIAASPRGGLWICSGGRVRRLVDGQWSADSPTFSWISHHAITEMMEDSQGQIWMGSWVEGVHWFRPDGTVERMTAETGFPGDTVSSVCEDREHNLWVGTYGGGLLRLKPRDFFSYGRSEGLPAHAVMSVAQTASGDIWAGLNTGGLVRLREGRFEGPMSMPFDWHRGTIRTLQARRDGTLWMGTSGPDILQWQEGGLSLQGRRNELGVGRVYSLFEDRKGALWIGGEKGLTVLDGPRMYSFTTLDGLSTNFVWAITQDRQGDLWIGTAGGGLNRLHAGTFHAFTTRDGLAIDSVRCLLADDDGTLWAGTWGGGLSRLRGGKFITYSSASGLPGNTIGAILDDHLGHLWLNTDRGIFRVAQKEWDAVGSGQKSRVEGTVYLRADGLPSVQCASGSPTGIRAQDGRLWFAMEKGLCVVDPRQIGFNSTPPLAVIEQIDVNGVRVFSNGLQVSSNAPPARDVPLRVPPGGRQVEIRYTGLSLSAPERVRFRYRLKGLEDQWEEADTRRVASYHSLGPGWYSFELHAANNDGVWSTQAASFDFRVLPFWWQTAWFRSLAAMTLLGGVWGGYQVRIRRLTRARVLQQEFSRHLIASQEGERKRIAAELHDSLGQNLLVIKSRVTRAQQQAEAGGKLAEQLGEAADMTLLAIREVREISQNLRPVQLDELGLTKALASVVRKVSSATAIQFESEIADLDEAFPPESEINFYRVLQECLNNVVKHSKATQCGVVVTRNAREVRLSVTDNGVGFVAAQTMAHPSAREGFGLTGIAERVHFLGGKVEFSSVPNQGTVVTVTVPLRA